MRRMVKMENEMVTNLYAKLKTESEAHTTTKITALNRERELTTLEDRLRKDRVHVGETIETVREAAMQLQARAETAVMGTIEQVRGSPPPPSPRPPTAGLNLAALRFSP